MEKRISWIPAFAGMTDWLGSSSYLAHVHFVHISPIFASPQGEGFPPSPKRTLNPSFPPLSTGPGPNRGRGRQAEPLGLSWGRRQAAVFILGSRRVDSKIESTPTVIGGSCAASWGNLWHHGQSPYLQAGVSAFMGMLHASSEAPRPEGRGLRARAIRRVDSKIELTSTEIGGYRLRNS